jgi:tRNA-splicing ligase RtcB
MQTIETPNVPIKAWVDGVAFEDAARRQVENVASMPFIYKHVAVMPDVHWGMGATVGSVIATQGAIIPAAVGVDIGCGMVAARLDVAASDLPDSLATMRSRIERAVPHGRTANGGPGDRGAWKNPPGPVATAWGSLKERFDRIVEKHPKLAKSNHEAHLGTLGTGNHFIEVCLDEGQGVWVMLHSGSRGIGNRIGSTFIELAKEDMRRHVVNLPDQDLAYLSEGTTNFDDYVLAVGWAQDYALTNRALMLDATVKAVAETLGKAVTYAEAAVQCHHNYVSREQHFGADVLVTRKGAVRARAGELGIIPGSMGTRSYIVRGKGNPLSFESCSHGAGRRMSRGEAKRTFTLDDHAKAVEGVECRRDKDVLDETPGAYKPIDAVMDAQKDLVDVVHELKQVLCVKG